MSEPTARTRVVTEPLGGSPLSHAVQEGRLPPRLQPGRPRALPDWVAHAARVRASAPLDWLAELRPALAATGAAQERLSRASQEGFVVTTGQQAGLFGGPLYTLSKALSALALADALQEALGMPVAPVFWAATDDADFREAATVHVAGPEGLQRLELHEAPLPGTPMSRAPLGNIAELLRQLRRACGSGAHHRFLEMAQSAFSRQPTLGAAYVTHLRDLLQPLGIAVLDSSHPVVRGASMPLLRRALERASDIHVALAAAAEELRAAGFEPQVGDDRGLSLVFAHEQGLKRRLSVEEAGRAVDGDASAYSPNVLLRPVIERAILPTAAYVAGPGELAYFAQVAVVAQALDAAQPVPLPRWSATVIEPHTTRALRRLGITPAECADAHALEARFARQALPAAVADSWAGLQRRLGASLEELEAAVRDTRLVPLAVIEGLRRSLAHKLGRAERRLLAAAKRRDDQVRRDIVTATAALYPLGQRQERVLNFVPMLARGGDELLSAMLAEARVHAAGLVPAGTNAVVPTG